MARGKRSRRSPRARSSRASTASGGMACSKRKRTTIHRLSSLPLRPGALRGFLNGADIREVLQPSRSQLGGDQIVLRNKKSLKPSRRVKYSFHPTSPCGLENDARKVGDNVEASRIASEAKEAAAVREFLRADAFKRGAELGKRRVGCLRVRRVCLYEKVHVLGKAWLRVKDDGVTAHNQVFNAMGMEGGQKVFVVLVHPAPSPSL